MGLKRRAFPPPRSGGAEPREARWRGPPPTILVISARTIAPTTFSERFWSRGFVRSRQALPAPSFGGALGLPFHRA